MKKILTILLVLFLLTGCQFVDDLFEADNSTDNESSTILLDLNLSDESTDTDEEVTTEPEEEEEEPSTDVTDTSTLQGIPVRSFKEGDLVKFKDDIAYDPDGDQLEYDFSLPLDSDGEWQTEIGDAGEYLVFVTVSDGKLESSQKFKLVIEAVNMAPKITGFNDVNVKEGGAVSLSPTVTDEDGDDVELTYSGFMTTSSYVTTYSDAGVHVVKLTATDGKQTVEKTIMVTVDDVNRAPSLSAIEDVTLTEGETVSISAKAVDPDGDNVEIDFGKPLDNQGSWETEVGDAGTYEIDITASDGDEEDTALVLYGFDEIGMMDDEFTNPVYGFM